MLPFIAALWMHLIIVALERLTNNGLGATEALRCAVLLAVTAEEVCLGPRPKVPCKQGGS